MALTEYASSQLHKTQMALLAAVEVETQVWKKAALFFVLITFLLWSMVPLYFGSIYNPAAYANNLPLTIVNFDRGNLIGDAFRTTAKNLIDFNQKNNIFTNWNLPDEFTYSSTQDVIRLVKSGAVWGAIVVNQGASATLLNAATNADVNYSPKSAITIIFDSGRGLPTTVKDFVIAPMRILTTQFQSQFTLTFIQSLGNGNATLALIASKSPLILSTPVSWTEMDLANIPASSIYITNSGLSIGLLFMIFFTFACILIIYEITQEFAATVTASTMISIRSRYIIFFSLTLSLFYSLLMAAFQTSFSVSSWFGFWSIQFLHLTAHSFTFIFLKLVFSSLLLAPIFLFVIIINIISVFGTIELADTFYNWYLGTPMFNCVSASRYFILNGFTRLGVNYGVLISWIVISIVLYVFIQIRVMDTNDDLGSPLPSRQTIDQLEKRISTSFTNRHSLSFRDNFGVGNVEVDEFRSRRRRVAQENLLIDSPEPSESLKLPKQESSEELYNTQVQEYYRLQNDHAESKSVSSKQGSSA